MGKDVANGSPVGYLVRSDTFVETVVRPHQGLNDKCSHCLALVLVFSLFDDDPIIIHLDTGNHPFGAAKLSRKKNRYSKLMLV